MINTNLASQAYWDNAYSTCQFHAAPPRDRVRRFIEQTLRKNTIIGDCLEIGCFPGRYLPIFGSMGFRLSGIDLTPRVVKELPTWLKQQGFNIGTFVRANFLTYHDPQLYEVVCSFGFIEHFTDFESVILKHAALVKPGGLLIITAPNFAGIVQHYLHQAFDTINLARHNLRALDPSKWAEIVQAAGFNLAYFGPFGRFDFWVDAEERSAISTAALLATLALSRTLSRLPIPNSNHYSPYCALVAFKE